MSDDARIKSIEYNKSKYGKVYSAPLTGSTECIFRPLTVSEYEFIEDGNLSSVEAEDIVVSSCVFWPENFDVNKYQPGLISSLSEEILELSGFSSIEIAQNILLEARDKSNTITNVMKATVLSLKPILDISLEDLNHMTFHQICETVTLAEQIIKIQKTIYDPSVELEISFSQPEEEDRVQEQTEDITALKLQQALYGG